MHATSYVLASKPQPKQFDIGDRGCQHPLAGTEAFDMWREHTLPMDRSTKGSSHSWGNKIADAKDRAMAKLIRRPNTREETQLTSEMRSYLSSEGLMDLIINASMLYGC